MNEVDRIKVGDMVRVNDIEHPHPLQVMRFKKVSGTFYAVLQNPIDPEDHCECIATKLQKTKNLKILFAGTWWDVKEIALSAGLTIYGIEDEPGHIDWITNPKGIKYDNEED